MRVLHIITDLDVGGAESMLVNLANEHQKKGIKIKVIGLAADGEIGARIRSNGIDVEALGLQPGRMDLRRIFRCIRIIQDFKPDIIQTWMYHADFVGSLAGLISGHRNIIWGLHHTYGRGSALKRSTSWLVRVNSRLSHLIPRRIVCCSPSAYESHAEFGYAKNKMIVIFNGIDLKKFQNDPTSSASVRSELSINPESILIGMVARFHPSKNHHMFIKAANQLLSSQMDIHFILAGRDVTPENNILLEWINSTIKPDRFHLLGQRDDMVRLYSALDILTLPSNEEALPLTLVESMACGTPCVATDVGDCKIILSENGICIDRDDVEALINGWTKILSLSRDELINLKENARVRVTDQFDILKIGQDYLDVYQQSLKG